MQQHPEPLEEGRDGGRALGAQARLGRGARGRCGGRKRREARVLEPRLGLDVLRKGAEDRVDDRARAARAQPPHVRRRAGALKEPRRGEHRGRRPKAVGGARRRRRVARRGRRRAARRELELRQGVVRGRGRARRRRGRCREVDAQCDEKDDCHDVAEERVGRGAVAEARGGRDDGGEHRVGGRGAPALGGERVVRARAPGGRRAALEEQRDDRELRLGLERARERGRERRRRRRAARVGVEELARACGGVSAAARHERAQRLGRLAPAALPALQSQAAAS